MQDHLGLSNDIRKLLKSLYSKCSLDFHKEFYRYQFQSKCINTRSKGNTKVFVDNKIFKNTHINKRITTINRSNYLNVKINITS